STAVHNDVTMAWCVPPSLPKSPLPRLWWRTYVVFFLSAVSSAHKAQRRWSHRGALEAVVHGHYRLTEFGWIVSYLRIDHFLAVDLLATHVDTTGHEVHVEPHQHRT